MRGKIRKLFKSLMYPFHKTFFYRHYKKVTELLVPNLFKFSKIGLGREGDGRYILPAGLINDDNVLLSFGVETDISFEEDFMKLYPKTTVLAFDPSIAKLPKENTGIIFQRKGVAAKDSKEKNLVAFESIFKEHKINKQVIVKMDIEGWEWGIFNEPDFYNYDIPVITIEFHMMDVNTKYELIFFPYHFWKRLFILRKVLKHYYIFHLHANNYGYTKFKSFVFPWLFELTLVKKNIFFDEIANDINTLNSVNCAGNEDIHYPFFK